MKSSVSNRWGSSSALVLIEQVIAIAVFALAAATCIQILVYSHQTTVANEERDQAVRLAQTGAELCRAQNGDLSALARWLEMPGPEEADSLCWYTDEIGEVVGPDQATYQIYIQAKAPQQAGTRCFTVAVSHPQGDRSLFSLDLTLQGVLGNE